MRDFLKIKEQLYEACLLFVKNRLETVTNVIESNKKAMFSETKSSAGDKHETGRAMLQLEMEKAGQWFDFHGRRYDRDWCGMYRLPSLVRSSLPRRSLPTLRESRYAEIPEPGSLFRGQSGHLATRSNAAKRALLVRPSGDLQGPVRAT